MLPYCLLQLCEDNEIHVDAVLTQFVDAWGDKQLTKLQFEHFLEITNHLKYVFRHKCCNLPDSSDYNHKGFTTALHDNK